jgi:nicotinamidase-related amidase
VAPHHQGVAMSAMQAIGEGYNVFVVADACNAVRLIAHEMSVRRHDNVDMHQHYFLSYRIAG